MTGCPPNGNSRRKTKRSPGALSRARGGTSHRRNAANRLSAPAAARAELLARAARRGARGGAPSLVTGLDPELGEGSVEVTADRPGRHEQPLRDLLVRQARCRKADNLVLPGIRQSRTFRTGAAWSVRSPEAPCSRGPPRVAHGAVQRFPARR